MPEKNPRTTPPGKAMESLPGTARQERDAFSVVGVGIGASAGDLEALLKFLEGLPVDSGMAFVLVQHLDPKHDSMTVDMLAQHTKMSVRPAADNIPIERNCVYVIPPGRYLSVTDRKLHLSRPGEPHGSRLPFCYFLRSLAIDLGNHTICVVLSGSGAGGSLGAKAVREAAGLVVAQDPAEAAVDSMPRSAILTGAVDMVLPVAEIPDAIVDFDRRLSAARSHHATLSDDTSVQKSFSEIIDLLRSRTGHDFTSYKQGTLKRQIDRRRAMARSEMVDLAGYAKILSENPGELDLLAKDMYIHVTGFFRDLSVFDLLASKTIPELVQDGASNATLRVWSVGCSTGEEAYSLAMVLREAMEASGSRMKLQLFASDIDADAVATARKGSYPETIVAEVSPERLARFFAKEEHGYRVLPELRELVVFTVHDVVNDPPFSRLDLVLCRNMLIYLKPETHAKVLTLFHFALRDNGLLLLGGSERIAADDHRFEVLSKQAPLYRHVGRARPGELASTMKVGELSRRSAGRQEPAGPRRDSRYAELCRDLVVGAYAPAAVLIDHEFKVLYTLGPTDHYLSVEPGHVTNNLIAMMRQTGLQARLRLAVQRAAETKEYVVVDGDGQRDDGTGAHAYSIAVHPVEIDGKALSLICFIDEPKRTQRSTAAQPRDESAIAELQRELKATQVELDAALYNLALSNEEQDAINEEALSVNEEFQTTNAELATSKDELQSLNEELVALNSQLQETLELQRTTASDFENILRSTDVAMFFLDADLNIRFFTPAARTIFNVISTDIGRPLADFRTVGNDPVILSEARTVMRTETAKEREIPTEDGRWFVRRILPYNAMESRIGGVVITYTEITVRKRSELDLEIARQQAEEATIVKSRFLATASHDLRQPLQTISLIQGTLEKTVKDEKAQSLIRQLDWTLNSMSGMLDTLLDINRIETGNITPEPADIRLDTLFGQLREEFAYQAEARRLELRVVHCGLTVRTDPNLLNQMLRNLLSNALKYTQKGKILLGCRQRADSVAIEIRDTGIGIPNAELQAIFEEYYQVGNPRRERSPGLGLGLSTVRHLADLLDHRVSVRSDVGKGSVFAIEVPRAQGVGAATSPTQAAADEAAMARMDGHRRGSILIVEDDPNVRGLLDLLLTGEGHTVVVAGDGPAALQAVSGKAFRPDLLLADFNLPNGMNGIELATTLEEQLGHSIPVALLTGDISVDTIHEIEAYDCLRLNKPFKADTLSAAVQRLLSSSPAVLPGSDAPTDDLPGNASALPTICVIDDSDELREILQDVLGSEGFVVQGFATGESFLETWRPDGETCLLLDAKLPGMSGLELLGRLRETGHRLPVLVLTGFGDVKMAVDAMKRGATDFIEKPVGHEELLTRIRQAIELTGNNTGDGKRHEESRACFAKLTPRQYQILMLILAGHPNKNIAADLDISQRTVESHRAAIMKKSGCRSLPALARLAVAAGLYPDS